MLARLAALAARCPAWLRHALVVYAATAAGIVLQAVVDARGVTAVDWAKVGVDALDTGAYTTATGLLILVATPATRRYGVGSGKHVQGA
jgi:hypothetical protein